MEILGCYNVVTIKKREVIQMNKKRVDEIISSISAFTDEGVTKAEYLSELKKLQSEIVNMTFNEDHASTGELRIWDVEKHLEQMNETYGHVADEELFRFKEGSKELANLIRAEISGSRGEFSVFNTLRNIKGMNRVLKNIEICEDEYHTEIDGIVIAQNGITIIEVKNSVKNIYIDEKGNFYRTGSHNRLDCNIADKMRVREQAVRDILEKAGYGNIAIRSLVVFTNSMIELVNRCDTINVVFIGQMIGTLEQMETDGKLSPDEIIGIAGSLGDKAYTGRYYAKMDTDQYKQDFASLMAILEEVSAASEEVETEKAVEEEPEVREITIKEKDSDTKIKTWMNWLKPVGKVVGTIALSAMTTIFINKFTGRRN